MANFESPVRAYTLLDWQCEELDRYATMAQDCSKTARDFRIHLTDTAYFLSRQPRFYDPWGEFADYSEEAFIAILEFFDDYAF